MMSDFVVETTERMSLADKFTEILRQHMMGDDDIEAALSYARSRSMLEAMQGRWDDDIEGYPISLLSALWISVKDCVLEWIEANKPLAWYKPLFNDALMQEIEQGAQEEGD